MPMQFNQPQPTHANLFQEVSTDTSNKVVQNHLYAFLTVKQWIVGLLLSSVAMVSVYSYCAPFTGWVAVALFVTALMVFHFAASLGKLIPIPHIAIFTAAMSYVIAPLASFYNPPSNRSYIIDQPDRYFEYACPAYCLVVLGWLVPYLWDRSPLLFPTTKTPAENPANETTLLIIFWFSLALTLLRYLVPLPGSIAFFVILLSHLRFVSCGAWVAAGRKDRAGYLIIVALIELLNSIYTSMFHELILWAACTFCLWVGSRAPSRLITMTFLLAGAAVLFPLQQAKTRYRSAVSINIGSGTSIKGYSDMSAISDRAELFKNQLIETVTGTKTQNTSDRTFGDDLVRFNQGWLVARVLGYVPNMEPFAEGETIKVAMISAVIPRLLYSDKFEAGGRDTLRRYAGIYLSDNTSMNIGYIGEFYANFGDWGGIFGCFGYALILSLFFRWVSLMSAINIHLAGLVSFFCFRMPVAESDVADVFTYITKALVVIGLLRLFAPPLFQSVPNHDMIPGQE